MHQHFIGRTNGCPIAVGGSYYTALIDAATNSNTASAIVKRDANGAFSGRLYGTANDALQWTTKCLLQIQQISVQEDMCLI